MKNWYQKQPTLFKKRVYNLAGLAIYSLIILSVIYPELKAP